MSHFKVQNKSRNTKLRVFRTVVRPVIRCAAETWSRDVKETNFLVVLERKVLRKITGPVKKNDEWRSKTDTEPRDIYK